MDKEKGEEIMEDKIKQSHQTLEDGKWMEESNQGGIIWGLILEAQYRMKEFQRENRVNWREEMNKYKTVSWH